MDPSDMTSVKIADFGLSIKLTGGNSNFHLDEKCGTLLYQSPEQEKADSYGKPADVWAVGFMMYEMIALKHPLWDIETDTRDSYREKLKSNPKISNNTDFEGFTELAKNFFKHLCHYRPSNRYTVETALMHPWITRKKKQRIPLNPLDDGIYLYEKEKKLKKLINIIHFMSIIKSSTLKSSPKNTLKQRIRKTQTMLQREE